MTGWRPPAGTWIVSADDHLIEPDNLWQDRLASADRDRAPRMWRDETGFHMAIEEMSLDVPGLPQEFSEGREGYWDQRARLKDMDAEGIAASIVFHGRAPALIAMKDKEFYVRCIDVFNEWMAEWCSAAPRRLYGVAMLPTLFNPAATKDYIQKIKQLGFHSMELPSSPRGVRYNSAAMEPMWSAIEESGIPISFHIGAQLDFIGTGSLGANLNRNLQPFHALWGLLTFSGVLERHPDMKVVFTEGGAGWVASTLQDADKIYRDYFTELRPKLAHPPSFYWHRQCYATFMDDPLAIQLVDRIGTGNMMWSVDYPHPEGVFGQSFEIMHAIFDRLGAEAARRVIGGTAAKLWNIPPPESGQIRLGQEMR
jgi:predicted TIM-barrel fold metal-dependent hydrolase